MQKTVEPEVTVAIEGMVVLAVVLARVEITLVTIVIHPGEEDRVVLAATAVTAAAVAVVAAV